jgi:leucyl aminopeptidase (aminopeptidase T)
MGKSAKLNDGIVSPAEASSKVFIDRYVSLPTGSIYFIPDEKSGNGTIVSRNDVDIDSNPLENVKGVVKNGEIMEMSAKKGNESVSKFYTSLVMNDKHLSGFTFGVNPDLKIGMNPLWFMGEAEGMVYIGFGGNIMQGGSNDAKNGWNFPVVKATVEVDGKVIINNGKLTL